MVKVLLVEDNLVAAKVEIAMLTLLDLNVTCAYTAKEALEVFDSTFDLMIVDIGLPGTNGFEFIAQLQAQADLSQVVVIMLSAHTKHAVFPQADGLGVHSIWEKPLTIEKARAIVALVKAV